MATIPTAALVRRGMELISNLVAMIDARASLSLRSDMAEFIAHMIHILDSANHNNAAVDAVAQQLRDRLCVVHKLSLYPPTGPQLNRVALREFKNLSEMVVNQCPPSTIVDLCELRGNLTSLIVTNSGIVDIADVLASHAPRKLRSKLPPIILQDSKVSIPMKYCWTNLTKLSLSNCGIVRMDEAFHFFPLLTHLDLSNNDIIHVVHLHDCVSLESLNLSYNRIRVLSNLERVIGRVKKINLAHNDIESLDGLDKIYALEKINLSFNYINDMAEVRHLCRLPNLEAVYLSDNPIAELSNYRLRFYREFIVHGTIMNGNRPFPSLDRTEITKKERKKLRKLMFRAPVDALRESSYHDNPEDFANEFYDDEDEDGAMTIIEEEDGEETEPGRYGNSTRDSFYNGGGQGRDSFYGGGGGGGGGQADTNRYSMRFSVDRSSSTAYSGSQFAAHSPNKMRQSSVIAPHFFRTVSTVRSSSTLTGTAGGSGGGGGGGGGFMAKRKFTKRAKRVAAIADSDEPEVYPKLQEVLTQIATKKEQELQLQRAKEVMEKALKVIHSQQSAMSGDVTPTHESKDSASLTPRTLSGTRTPPNLTSRPVSTKLALDFPAVHEDGPTATTTRHSLRLDSSAAPSSSVPDAILFPRDLDPKMRVSDHHIVLPAHIENGQLRPSSSASLSRSHSRESMTMMPPTTAATGMTPAMTAAAMARANSSSSSGHRDSDLLLASMDPYIGDPQYKSLNILDNLELYFREQVFNPKRPSYPQIYLHEDLGRKEKLPAGLQHALCLIAAYHPDERLMTMFCEKVIDITALDSRSGAGGVVGGGHAGTTAAGAAAAAAMAGGDDDDDDDGGGGGGGGSGGGAAAGNNKQSSVEKPMAIILSDQALYFIAMEEIASSYTFADAPVFTVQAHYPLYQLSVCTIYFGFQRCTLTFSHPAPATKANTNATTNSTVTTTATTTATSTSFGGGGSHNAMHSPAVTALTSALSSSPAASSTIPLSTPNSPTRSHAGTSGSGSSATATATATTATTTTMGTLIAKYMIITREKSRAYPLITRIPQVANQIRNNHQPMPLTNVKIENKDSQLIEQVTRYIQAQGDHDIVFYQMCFQTRSKAPTVLLPRSIILTQSLILLCYEDLLSTEVQLNVLECWKLKDIHKIAVDDNNPMQLVLTFAKRTNVIGNRKKWRITTDSRNASSKLLEELRRACNDLGNLLM